MTTNVKLGSRLPSEIAVFDLETTGIDVETARIVTAFVGVMNVSTGLFTERWNWIVNPGVEIPTAASDVHGVTTERARAEGMDPKEAVFQILQRLDILDRKSLALVIMNASFDLTILDRELERHWPGIKPLNYITPEGKYHGPVVFDPMVLDRAFDKWRKGKRQLVDLARVYGVPVEENAHEAEADCRMAGRVAIKLMTHSRLLELSLSEVHDKLIITKRNQARDLADYWKRSLHSVAQAERPARIESIKDVEEFGHYWPFRPREARKGVGE